MFKIKPNKKEIGAEIICDIRNICNKDFINRHNKIYRVKETIQKFTDEEMNHIADKITQIPEDKITLGKVFATAVFKKPSMIIDVMRMFAGFGTPKDTNERFKFLLANGESGLSTAFDMPTLYGYDTDDERAAGEFGKCGVAVS